MVGLILCIIFHFITPEERISELSLSGYFYILHEITSMILQQISADFPFNPCSAVSCGENMCRHVWMVFCTSLALM